MRRRHPSSTLFPYPRPSRPVVDDAQADPRLPASVKDGYAQLDIAADLATPVLVDGTLRCTLSVNQRAPRRWTDRKSTRLNSSHANISYAVFCLKKKHTYTTQ